MSKFSLLNFMSIPDQLKAIAKDLAQAVNALSFAEPVTHVYNPLDYAWNPFAQYVERHAQGVKKVLFMGMNPGPFGMAQVGVPFGEIAAVRDWVGVEAPVAKPHGEHPKRPIEGFACQRSEVSGRRLWWSFADWFGTAETFFADHFVINYCPLVFMKATGANVTPDKLPASEAAPLYEACDAHLRTTVEILQPDWLIGVGGFAEARANAALAGENVQIGRILHPSPASPAANRDWAGTAKQQLVNLGILA